MADTTTQNCYFIAKATTPKGEPLALSAQAEHSVPLFPNFDKLVCVKKLNYSDQNQMWQRLKIQNASDKNHDCFGLINVGRNMCIIRQENHQGTRLELVSIDKCQFDELAQWRFEDYGGINSVADWEQKINIPGNGPYTDGQFVVTWEYSHGGSNEIWRIVGVNIKEEIQSFEFNIPAAALIHLPPTTYTQQSLANQTSVQQSQEVDVSYTKTNHYSFTDTTGTKITSTMGFKVKVPEIGAEFSASLSVETDVEYSSTTSKDDSTTVTVKFNPIVPPNSTVVCTALIQNGQLSVPYTAVIKRTFPDNSTAIITNTGTFVHVNSWNISTTMKPVPMS